MERPASFSSAAVSAEAARLADMELRLREAEETLDAIRNGDVDAVVVGGPSGQQVYTLENADRPYRVLIERMQEGAVTLGGDGVVLYCNQRFAAIVGRARESILGAPVTGFVAPGDRAAFRALLDRAPEDASSGEVMLVSAAGGEVPVNLSLVDLDVGKDLPRVVCGVITDLTQNRRRADELAAANARLAREIEERIRAEDSLRLALDAAEMGNWDLDLVTGTARRSPRHDRIFGYGYPLPGWTLDEAISHFLPEDRDGVVAAFDAAKTAGSLDFEARIRRAGDGEVRWLHVKGQTRYEGAFPVRIAGVVSDITGRRAVEEQLRQAQKMEAVGQLTGGIAHDFNNLLTIIGGSLELLSRRVALDDRTTRLFEAARQGVARGARLNQQLLAFSRRQDLRREVVCVNNLVPDFAHLLDRAVGETVAVNVVKAERLWFCFTDPHQLETAILNLAINARDAMPDGGEMTVATENREVAAETAQAVGASPGDYVAVTVSDTGVGMAPEVAAHVFEPFFTTKEVGKGTGLGLSQVYGFAKQSDGFVTIETEAGRGTAVSIHLPRTLREPAPEPLAATAVEPAREGGGVILVVEDDPDVRRTTCGLLRDLGYAVREAATGREALGVVEGGAEVDLVFTDVIMPDGMSGIELARELRERRPGLPVLLTSGYTAQRAIPEALARDLRLLQKPYAAPDLAAAVRAALGRNPPAA